MQLVTSLCSPSVLPGISRMQLEVIRTLAQNTVIHLLHMHALLNNVYYPFACLKLCDCPITACNCALFFSLSHDLNSLILVYAALHHEFSKAYNIPIGYIKSC